MKRSPRDEFLRAFRLAGIEAYDKIQAHTDKLGAELRKGALEALKTSLAPPAHVEPRIAARAPAKQLPAPRAARTVLRDAPKVGAGRGGGTVHCSKCGAAGFQSRSCGITHHANGAIEPPEDLEDEPEDDEEPSTRARELEATKTRKGTKGTSNVSSSARAILDPTRRARAEVEDATA